MQWLSEINNVNNLESECNFNNCQFIARNSVHHRSNKLWHINFNVCVLPTVIMGHGAADIQE